MEKAGWCGEPMRAAHDDAAHAMTWQLRGRERLGRERLALPSDQMLPQWSCERVYAWALLLRYTNFGKQYAQELLALE